MGLWSWSVEAVGAQSVAPEWYNEETLRGEFVRAMRNYTAHDAAPPDLQPYLPAGQPPTAWPPPALFEDAAVRRRVLAQATALGADLLSGEEPHA